jgi:hypothetical protein
MYLDHNGIVGIESLELGESSRENEETDSHDSNE